MATAQAPKKVQKLSPLDVVKKMWSTDRKALIQHAVILGGLVVLIVFIIIPISLKTFSMKAQSKELEVQAQSAKARAIKIPDLKKDIDRYNKEIESAEKKFSDIKALDQLVGTLSKMAADAQVLMVGSRPTSDRQQSFPEPYNKKYLTASYELILEGGYHQIGRLLSKIEQGEFLILIREIVIRPSTGKQADKLQCVVQFDAFVRAPQGI